MREVSSPKLEVNYLGALGSTVADALEGLADDLSESSIAVLLTLKHRTLLSTSELAEIVKLSQSACTRAIDKLAEAGLAVRTPSERNEVRISLTNAGQRRANQLQKRRAEILDGLLGALNDAQRVQFAELTARILAQPVTGRRYARQVCRFCDHKVCDGVLCPVGCAATRIEKSAAHIATDL